MNESFKHHMMQINNSSKPTLKQINDSFFEASERYQETLKSSEVKKFSKGQSEKVTSTNAKVTYQKDKAKFHPCILCSTAEQEANCIITFVCFDLCKAFNQITLSDTDSNKLLFLWFRNVEMGNFQNTGYHNVRLSFGLRCSPTLLMLGLHKILILDAVKDPEEIKKLKTCIC